MAPSAQATRSLATGRPSSRRLLVDAARQQLLDPRGLVAFNIDAVARRAGVSRQTVYNQFSGKAGLLEAVCDAAALRTRLAELLPAAMARPAPAEAVADFVRAFCTFWATDRDLHRRTRGLAELDPDYAAVLAARDQRRIDGLSVLISRFAAPPGFSRSAKRAQLLRLLQTLTSFATFDGLAGPHNVAQASTRAQVAGTVTDLALASIRQAGLTVA